MWQSISDTLFNAPKTPAMQAVSFFTAVLVIVVWAPSIYNSGQEHLLPFLESQYGPHFGFPVSLFVWAILFPIMFYMMKGTFASSLGAFMLYFVDKIGLF